MHKPDPSPQDQARDAVSTWLDQVVVGLGLCPFAAVPWREERIRIAICDARDEEGVLVELATELELLRRDPAIETTLLVLTSTLGDFLDYNDHLDRAEALLEHMDPDGAFQIASFHPDYRFADTAADDPGNLTNRAPYPILHLLREESVSRAVEGFPDVDGIPARNIQRMRQLDDEARTRLFPWLKMR